MRPLAIIPVYNEADILPAVLKHLESQGCDVYLLDNWSTDSISSIHSDGIPTIYSQAPFEAIPSIRFERWPAERPTMYDWTAILRKIEDIALEKGKGRWVILHDADEIRRAPESYKLILADALDKARQQGYNAVKFEVRTFAPVDNSFKPGTNPEDHFRYYRPEHIDKVTPHIKAWFQGDQKVDIHSHGGHQAVFAGRNVCPTPFLLKHYPIRSQAHGEQKVLVDRFPRYNPEERAKQWHVQYLEFVKCARPNFIENPKDLVDDRRTSIITLTRFPEIFSKFAESVETFDPTCRRIVVTSGGITINRPGWEVVVGVEPFIFSRNLNLGIAAAGTDDVLCVNDDVEFVGPIVKELSEVAYLSSAGVVTPQIIGNGIGNHMAKASVALKGRWEESPHYIPFVCVFLRRSVLNSLGGLDERFSGYGGEDVEFGLRSIERGLPMIVSRCQVKHGYGDSTCSSSFKRVMTDKEQLESAKVMLHWLADMPHTDMSSEAVKSVLSVIA